MKELTILIPCLNEKETIGQVIDEANQFLEDNHVCGEVLVADNGSNDGSIEIVKSKEARIINVEEKGYGMALIEGTKAANGKYIIMGDADYSYNLYDIKNILEKLQEGYDLVVGNRLNSNIEKGAMPFLHRYLGTPIISTIGNVIYDVGIKDFNSGLRGYDKEKLRSLDLVSPGFEYATEMLIKAKKNNLQVAEVDIRFRKDKRNRKPHLRPIKDGIRHVKVLIKNVK
ncbi:MAG: glycosyltransferase family 2 protein [Clostridia bacterium]|nr:glycosyltransferase family 2 protein [Clostridia bacterium]